MKVGDLKKVLRGLPDDIEVLVPGEEHSYRETEAMVTTALRNGSSGWAEDHRETLTSESKYVKRVSVVVID